MSDPFFPFPTFTPLTRLNVQDSLRINAERWSLAHNYHRQRQNIHYQALWEPGIICGLGVKPIAPPRSVPSQFKDQRWLEIQPGLAIDLQGNPIVVNPEEDRTYRIAAPTPLQGSRTVYVVVRYVDPERLDVDPQGDRLVERFRFDQRLGQLQPGDIELCRIELAPGELSLQAPANPFTPDLNEIDLRYRHPARLRTQAQVQLGTLTHLSHQEQQSWQALFRSLPVQCPSLQGQLISEPIQPLTVEALTAYSMVYGSTDALLRWQAEQRSRELGTIQRYLNQGGLLLLIATQMEDSLQRLLNQLTAKVGVQPVSEGHPLLSQPFQFGQLPAIERGTVDLLYGAGILIIWPDLVTAWNSHRLPRQDIRDAQELGANLLHFAWQRRHFYQLLT